MTSERDILDDIYEIAFEHPPLVQQFMTVILGGHTRRTVPWKRHNSLQAARAAITSSDTRDGWALFVNDSDYTWQLMEWGTE